MRWWILWRRRREWRLGGRRKAGAQVRCEEGWGRERGSREYYEKKEEEKTMTLVVVICLSHSRYIQEGGKKRRERGKGWEGRRV